MKWFVWQSYTASDRPGRWSLSHATKDGRTFLCGRKTPDICRVFRMEQSENNPCRECERRTKEKRS